MTKLVNLTPHALTVLAPGGQSVTLPPSGQVARVAQTDTLTGAVVVDGLALPVAKKSFGAVEGLPLALDGVAYVVSGLVLAALGDSRPDVYAPGTLVRDANGVVTGCNGLSQ